MIEKVWKTLSWDNKIFFDSVLDKTAAVYLDQIKDKTFVARVKRSGNHTFKSTEIERYVGAGLLKKLDALGINGRVSLKNPEVKVAIEKLITHFVKKQ